MSIEITPVDPADEDAIRDFCAVYQVCSRHDWTSFTPMPLG